MAGWIAVCMDNSNNTRDSITTQTKKHMKLEDHFKKENVKNYPYLLLPIFKFIITPPRIVGHG